jgi:hypothetical protein
MMDEAMHPVSGNDISDGTTCNGETTSNLVDSAISHAEKLRRVLELEEWIDGARDLPELATACRRWQEERAQLLAELHL